MGKTAEELTDWARINVKSRELEARGVSDVDVDMGVCNKCNYLLYQKTRYGSMRCVCQISDPPRSLHQEDPVIKCSNFYPKGHMTLAQMFAIAIPIEGSKKRRAGFLTEDDMDDDPMLRYNIGEDNL
jgi:hypothetical protein